MDITKLKQAEDALKRSLEFSQLHSDLANAFIELPPDEFGKTIENFLERVVEFTGVDRGTLVYWPEGDTSSREIYSWNRKGIKQYRLPVPSEKLSYLAETIRKGEIFSFSDINELFSEAEKDYFLNEGTKSTIMIPMMIEGKVLGALIFASFSATKTWPHDLVQQLRFIGRTFTYALERKHTEKAFRESEEKYRNLVELSPDPIVIIQDDRYRFINSAFTELLGYTQKDVDNGLSFYEVVQSHDKETVSRRYQDRISEKPVGKKFTINLISKEGKVIPFESSGIKINYNGRPAFMSIARDITERKQAEEGLKKAHDELGKRVQERTAEMAVINEQLREKIEEHKAIEKALRESEERYRSLFDNAGALIQVFDPDGISLMINETAADYYEGTPDDFVGKSFHDFRLQEADEYLERIQAIVKSGEGLSFDEFIRLPSGKEGWFLSNSHPLRDAGGNIIAVQIITQDITQRKKAEEALRKSREEYRNLLNLIPDPVVVIQDDQFSLINPALTKLLKYDQKDLEDGLDVFSIIHKDDRERSRDRLNRRLSGKKVYPQSDLITLISKDGTQIPCEIAGALINYSGRPADLAIIRDITERKRTEDFIRDLTHQLIMSQERERQMISHELHDTVAQDLSALRIQSKTLLEYKSLSGGIRKKISEIYDSLHNTLNTVRDISYYLRPPGLDKLELARILYQFCEDFSEKTGIRVDFNAAGIEQTGLNYKIKINLYRLVQEGLNNVRKHAYANRVSVKLVSSFPNIILRIEDDGKGFDLKERKASALKEKRMGLHSMEERTSLLQGRMDINSIPGKGTKITITIPCADEITEPVEDPVNL